MRFLLATLLIFVQPALGLVTQYISAEHPEGWKCELSQAVFICQATTEPERREALMMSIATLATEWDTLDNYESFLRKPKMIQQESGGTLESKVTYTRRRNINGTVWIDSLQYNSELPGFWARYLSTVQNKIAILITYIVSDEMYPKFAPQFERMVASLKVNKDFDLNVASQQGNAPLPGAAILGPKGQKDLLSSRLNVKNGAPAKSSPDLGGEMDFTKIGLLVVVILGAVVVLQRFKKKRG